MDDQELSPQSCAFLRNCWIAGYVSRPDARRVCRPGPRL